MTEGRVSSPCLYGRDPKDCSACQEAEAICAGRGPSCAECGKPMVQRRPSGRCLRCEPGRVLTPEHLADCMPFGKADSERTYWFCVADCEAGQHEREAHDASCPDFIDRGFCANVDANRPTPCPYWPEEAPDA